MPATPDDLFAFLQDHNIMVTTIEHAPVFRVEDAKLIRGKMEGGHTKNLFLKDKKNNIFLVVALEDTIVDLKNLHKRLGVQRLSFGKAELLMERLGVIPGAVTPFSVINDSDTQVKVILDERLLQHSLLNFHPLTNSMTTAIYKDDLLTFLDVTHHTPHIIDLTTDEEAITIEAE